MEQVIPYQHKQPQFQHYHPQLQHPLGGIPAELSCTGESVRNKNQPSKRKELYTE